jgi:hypothetical protein
MNMSNNRRKSMRSGRIFGSRRNELRGDNSQRYYDNFNDDYNYVDHHPGGGYSNRDYADNNFWHNSGDRWNSEQRDEMPESNYGSGRSTGYDDYDSSRRQVFDNEYEREMGDWRGEEMGYSGRNSNDYRSRHYGDHQYNPAEFDRGGYRRNSYSENENHYGDRSWSQRHGDSPRHDYDYGYYESYPSYGQSAPYNDHEIGYIRKQEAMSRRGVDNEDQYGRRKHNSQDNYRSDGERKRPMIRDKRY